jgi:hypothetical protein
MSSTSSRTSRPISQYCISCSRCGMLFIEETGSRPLRTRFGEHQRAIVGNVANQSVARHFNSGNHSVSYMERRTLCTISGNNDSRKRHEIAPHFQTWRCPSLWH